MRGGVLAATRSLELDAVIRGTLAQASAPRAPTTFSGVSIDSRTILPGELFVAIRGPRFDGHAFLDQAARRGAAAALVHRDVAAPAGLSLLRVPDTTAALGSLARHVRLSCGVRVVAITGSTGKTTTKEMLASLLETRGGVLKTEGNLNNQYGLPLTLLRLSHEDRFAVLELGMSGPGEIRLLADIARPDVAVITNVAAVHLEFFASVDDIARAKAEILEGLPAGGAAVLNGDDRRVWRIGEHHTGRILWFGRDRAWDVSAENWRGSAHGMRFDLRIGGESVDVALPLAGPHFVMDFLAAAAAAHHLGVAPATIGERATAMKPSPHRGEVHRLGERITLIDDSYNSNPLAVDAAVTALGLAGGGRRVAFLGDMLELGPQAGSLHRQAGESVGRRLDVLVGVGALAGALLEGARAANPALEVYTFADSAGAAGAAVDLVREKDAVLVKGSRGIHMEAVVEALLARFGRADRA